MTPAAGTRCAGTVALVLAALGSGAEVAAGQWQEAPRLPVAVSNNAVAGVETPTGGAVFSFGGMGAGRSPADITDRSFRWDVGSGEWTEIAPLPGPPRIAATAQAVGGRIVVFGGYAVAGDGTEATSPRTDIYDPGTDVWRAGAPLPVPVDDAVSGVWRDSLVFVVSGWSDSTTVAAVQVYDPAADRWREATPFPGEPVFGHAGGVVRDALIVVDGAAMSGGAPRYALARQVWRGDIDPDDPARIRWRRLPDHPGEGLYRSGAVAVGQRLVLVGGTPRPYNYDGRGYDGRDAEPVRDAWVFDAGRELWRALDPPARTMDHRNVARAAGLLVVVGGMDDDRRVSDRVFTAPLLRLVTGG